MVHWVVMGVSGCGKSSVGQSAAIALGLPYLEGDSYHPASNIQKMRDGIALTDADRAGWLQTLGRLLAQHPDGAVLSCSALKRRYRDVLRADAPSLQFAYLDLPPSIALQRVAQRGSNHFLPVTLVDSQFATLESPVGELGVLHLDATAPIQSLVHAILQFRQTQ